VRRFGTCTVDLDALADWLMDCGVITVAMASTGVYWIPLFELLEARGVQVLLIDPRQAKRAPGRPTTDRLDCQWLQRLHAYGLRAYLRHRQMLLTSAAHHIQHMHKALQQMNLKLTQVVSDLTGVTGMAIIKAILAGERDPQHLAKLRNPHCQHAEDDIAKALQGTGAPSTCLPCSKPSSSMHSLTSNWPSAISRSKAIWRPLRIKARGSPCLPRPADTRRPTNPTSMPAPRSIAWPAST